METLAPQPSQPELDLAALLEQKSAAAFFQPIVSIKKKAVVGLESAGRGLHPENRQPIEPDHLHRLSSEKNLALDLDRLFRRKGLEGFHDIRSKVPDLLLFLALDSSVLTRTTVGSGHLLRMVREVGLDPNSVVLELSQPSNTDEEALRSFVEAYRKEDFLIGLRDVGGDRASLDRILHLEPDVFKLDPVLSDGLSKDPYRRDTFRTLVGLSHRNGALVVANGVENEEDALVALELGADMLQGSYFSRPQRTENTTTLGLKARIVFVASRFKRQLTEKVARDKDRKNRYERIVKQVFEGLSGVLPSALGSRFPGALRAYPQLECLYLLDQDGVQVSETACNIRKVAERKRYLFQPAPKGTDHSLKDYYYSLVFSGLERYFTEPYVSLASGNLCVTVSNILREPGEGKPYVLCMDLDISRI